MPSINLSGKGAYADPQLLERAEGLKASRFRGPLDIQRLAVQRDLESALRNVDVVARTMQQYDRKKLDIARLELQGELRLSREREDSRRAQERDLRKAETQRRRDEQVTQRKKDEFWRGLGLAGLVGTVAGGGSFRNIAGAGAGALAYGAASALGAGAKAGIIAEAIGEVVKLAINPYSTFYGGAKPYYDYQKQSYMLGRAAGRSGSGIAGQFFYGGYEAPGWLSQLDMTPQEAVQALSSLGATPQGSYSSLAHTLAVGRLLPGFANMDPGAMYGAAAQGFGYGASPTAAGAQSYLTPIARMLADSSAAGMDRSKVLSSMESSLDIIAKAGGGGVSQSAVTSMLMRMAVSGAPGALTGQTTASMIGGLTNTLQNPTANPMNSVAMLSILPRFGNLRTAGDVRKFVGETNWQSVSPGYRDYIVGQITAAAGEGNLITAYSLASMNLMGADPNRLLQLQAPTLSAMTGGRGYLSSIMGAGMAGTTPGAMMQYQYQQNLFPGGLSQADSALMRYNGLGKGMAHAAGYASGVEGFTIGCSVDTRAPASTQRLEQPDI